MKKAKTIAALLALVIMSASCKKLYHCSCTYNNEVRYTKDLGRQFQDKAQQECSSYDTTVPGEAWNCTLY